jgi:hypothetical protein
LSEGTEDRLRRDRKYKAFWAAFFVATFMLAVGRLDGDNWVEFCTVVFGLYMVGNVGEHAAKSWENRGKGNGMDGGI